MEQDSKMPLSEDEDGMRLIVTIIQNDTMVERSLLAQLGLSTKHTAGRRDQICRYSSR